MAEDQQTANTVLALSNQMADAVATAAQSIVTVAARPRQSASGIIWSADQETVIVTADHVIEQEDEISVRMPDGQEWKVALVGRDAGTDIAVLRLPADSAEGAYRAASLSDSARVGTPVLAVGRPGAGGPRVSFGVISAIEGPRRSWQGSDFESIIFPDLTLYPGFSGGPLITLGGQVVGMCSSHLTRQNSTALPVVTLRRVVSQLITHGKVRRGYLGVGTQQVQLAEALAQKAGVTQSHALLVVTVEPGSPADQAGLLIGDTLVTLGDVTVADADALRSQLGAVAPGNAITLRCLRGGEPRDVSVTVGERE